jgi:carbonic anhydrase/acetyltransferase-like protein (isoleucine patch superfamily)
MRASPLGGAAVLTFEVQAMTIYTLADAVPELPPAGEFWVAPTASVMGRVRLGRGASIWFGAVLRGDNDWIEIGANTNVQDNSVLHTDNGYPLRLGDNVTVGHAVVLHSTIVGDYSLIGMNAALLSRSKVGRYCVVGAHALLPEDKEYPDRSLIVGAPARIVRTLTDKEVAKLERLAQVYTANAERFRRDLRMLDGD